MTEFVKAENLQHIKVPSNIHLWQVLAGQSKSLTNSQTMKMMESRIGFLENSFWENWLKQYNGKLPNGFYWVDHQANSFNVVLSNTWDASEYQLQQRGVVFSNYESS